MSGSVCESVSVSVSVSVSMSVYVFVRVRVCLGNAGTCARVCVCVYACA